MGRYLINDNKEAVPIRGAHRYCAQGENFSEGV